MQNCAVYTKDDYLTLYTTSYTPGHSMYKELQKGKKKKIQVPCYSLKTLMKEHRFKEIDILKIDIEGAEYEIIFNLEQSILDHIKYIVMECHKIDAYNVNDMVTYLGKKGFVCRFPYDFETLIVCSK